MARSAIGIHARGSAALYRLVLSTVGCALLAVSPRALAVPPEWSVDASAIGQAPALKLDSSLHYRSWQEVLLARLPSPGDEPYPVSQGRWRGRYRPSGGLARWAPEIEYRCPIDLGRQWQMSAEFCPGFLPEMYPGRTSDEFCYRDYLNSSWLEQRGWANPYRIAAEEVQRWNEDDDAALKRAMLAAAYWWHHRHSPDAELDTLQAALGREQYLSRELLAELVAPKVVELLPASLTEVTSDEGQVPIDLRIATNTSFDSATSVEHLLLHAARRGLKAVVVADRNRIDGAQRAQRVATRLRTEARLPADFRVIVGEYVDTTSGGIVALFVRTRVPEQMTMKKTLEMIHDQGGLALLAHPVVAGGPRVLRQMPFDGYLIQPGLFEMFRTLQILYDPALADKPALYASNSSYGAGVGLPYTIIDSADTDEESLREALADGCAYAAGGIYLPWMIAVATKPIGHIETTINNYFVAHDDVERRVMELVGADNIIIRTSWDRELQGWMGLDRLAEGFARIGDRTSPLLEWPQLEKLALEYSYFQLMYDRSGPTYSLGARYIW